MMTTELENTPDEVGQAPDTPAGEELSAAPDIPTPEPAEPEEVVVSLGDAPPVVEEERAPEWVRELRKTNRALAKEKKALEEKLNSLTAGNKPPVPGTKPTLEACDYDSERFESELAKWFEAKRQQDEEERNRLKEEQAQQAQWQQRMDLYVKTKTELKVKDFEDVEHEVQSLLNPTQLGIIVQGAENSGLVVYALGKNLEKAKEIAAISDPVKFAFAIAKLEDKLKVSPKKTPPPPERVPENAGGRTAGAVDSELERLREEAAKTGDYTKVANYKRAKRS